MALTPVFDEVIDEYPQIKEALQSSKDAIDLEELRRKLLPSYTPRERFVWKHTTKCTKNPQLTLN